jgi:hypothetical protein
MEMVLSLLEASKSLVFPSSWSFAEVHGPNLAFVPVESLMKARGDLDMSASGSCYICNLYVECLRDNVLLILYTIGFTELLLNCADGVMTDDGAFEPFVSWFVSWFGVVCMSRKIDGRN